MQDLSRLPLSALSRQQPGRTNEDRRPSSNSVRRRDCNQERPRSVVRIAMYWTTVPPNFPNDPAYVPRTTIRLKTYLPRYLFQAQALEQGEWMDRTDALAALILERMKQGVQAQLVAWGQNPILTWEPVERQTVPDDHTIVSRQPNLTPHAFFQHRLKAQMVNLPKADRTMEAFDSMFNLVIDYASGLPSMLIRNSVSTFSRNVHWGSPYSFTGNAALCMGEGLGTPASDSEEEEAPASDH